MNILLGNKKLALPNPSVASQILEELNLREPHQAIALKINGVPKDFSTPIHEGDVIEIFDFDSKEGKEVFWHTSAHVLAQAILRLWPEAKPTIGPPIENGFYYDFANLNLSEEDFPLIEKEVQKILSENFKPKRIVFSSKEEAKKRFANNPYKLELIDSFEDATLTGYEQGEFFDLCRGPHLTSIGKIKAFKVLKTSGAYWRGDSKNEMLTRVYGISFPDRKMLKEYLDMLEEAKKRDHRVIGKKLGLFSIHDEAPAMPFIHPNGMIVWNALLEFWRELHRNAHYVEIKTPQLMCQTLWERSGHWYHYRENMYVSEIDEKLYAIKPMNCPGCMIYYGSDKHSYRELPLRVAEIGHVHRHEFSGAVNGLFRVRSFHQDDAHIFMRPDQIKDEIVSVLRLVDTIYKTFGLSYHLELSTRPEKSKTIGSDAEWEVATNGLRDALDEWGQGYKLNEGDGAFYGPKIDCHVKDAIGRTWQCGTIQLDMALPEKFDLYFNDQDGTEKRPIMIHRAIFGSIERFFAIITEHFAGKFPLWLSPMPVRIIPVADRHLDYAEKLKQKIMEHGLLCSIDDSHESVGKKVRAAQLDQVNYMLTIGDQEMENHTINVRTRDNVVHGEMKLESFLSVAVQEKKSRSLTSGLGHGHHHS